MTLPPGLYIHVHGHMEPLTHTHMCTHAHVNTHMHTRTCKHTHIRVGNTVWLVEWLPTMYQSLGSTPTLHELGMVAHACNLSTQERRQANPKFKIILAMCGV